MEMPMKMIMMLIIQYGQIFKDITVLTKDFRTKIIKK